MYVRMYEGIRNERKKKKKEKGWKREKEKEGSFASRGAEIA